MPRQKAANKLAENNYATSLLLKTGLCTLFRLPIRTIAEPKRPGTKTRLRCHLVGTSGHTSRKDGLLGARRELALLRAAETREKWPTRNVSGSGRELENCADVRSYYCTLSSSAPADKSFSRFAFSFRGKEPNTRPTTRASPFPSFLQQPIWRVKSGPHFPTKLF